MGLSESVERGILAGFEIDVIEIRGPEPVLGLSEEVLGGGRLALLQTAALEHGAAHNLRTLLTFHQHVAENMRSRRSCPRPPSSSTPPKHRTGSKKAARPPASSIDAEGHGLKLYRHVPSDRVWVQ
ncbi:MULTISPECIES: hypothetical protein [unclassified Streptomyces]|uniref:hypothetical protein n=1 Tax=Streptomyces sp. NPDC055082 TaxID=3365718 RepID=UPI0037D11306